MAMPDGCNETLNKPYPQDGQLYCPPISDTVICWDFTPAGTRAIGGCPTSHPLSAAFSPNGYSFKDCTKNGTWWTHPHSGRPWSNYSTCISHEKIEKTHTVIYVYLSGFAVSAVLLVISMIIFSVFRQLRCTRVSMHQHLFMSYILSALLWILYYKFATLDINVHSDNPLWCRVLHVLTQYATLCNYAWMLCEGLYLQAIIALAFTNQKRLYIICCCIGWGFPLIPVGIYTAVRATSSTSKQLMGCWVQETQAMWILMGPIILSLVLNFIFLINILRILLSKLRAVNTNESHQYRRTARACLILVPLLGIQYIIMPFHPDGDTFIYDVIRALLNSYQGAFVALLFCFLNGEVLQCFKRYIQNCLGRHPAVSRSMTTNVYNDKSLSSMNESPVKSNEYTAIPLSEIKQHGYEEENTIT